MHGAKAEKARYGKGHPYDPIMGHLLFYAKMASNVPKDAHPHYLADMIRRELPELGPIYYLDTKYVEP